ncbi:MAG: hypothetical protein Ct9H300mP21_09950 [Pseudomonadota bacterium]|nr:MAG: hypothetical protein Ct9H300mP21_09950 [Pseudomonadota bacterium]
MPLQDIFPNTVCIFTFFTVCSYSISHQYSSFKDGQKIFTSLIFEGLQLIKTLIMLEYKRHNNKFFTKHLCPPKFFIRSVEGKPGLRREAFVDGYRVTSTQIKKEAAVVIRTSVQSINTGILFPPG